MSAATPAFTKQRTEVMATVNETALLQQQVAGLQTAASQNEAHIKELAEQLRSTVAALEAAAAVGAAKLRRDELLCVVAAVISMLTHSAVQFAVVGR